MKRHIFKFCKKFDISLLYQTKVGIKCTNQLIDSSLFPWFASSKIEVISPDDLYIGFDGLHDKYTLLGNNIYNSPHFELMQFLQNGKELGKSKYVERMANGTLDFRPASAVGKYTFLFFEKKFEEKLDLVKNESYHPIKLIKADGKYYIADGKHTASLCALTGKDVRCVDATHIAYDSFIWWVYKKMLKHKTSYSKHITYFESLISE